MRKLDAHRDINNSDYSQDRCNYWVTVTVTPLEIQLLLASMQTKL
jgi:hypothetical protein